FERVTGFTHEETVGRNCRFLQGPRSEEKSIALIRNAISTGVECKTSISNYTKDGKCFINLLTMHPVFNKK
ncbi:hypothetical protein SARC_17464, partial [Sphaeroforma arctica JP610]